MPFHINHQGNPGVCRAKLGSCPFAPAIEHYPTATVAREAYEKDCRARGAMNLTGFRAASSSVPFEPTDELSKSQAIGQMMTNAKENDKAIELRRKRKHVDGTDKLYLEKLRKAQATIAKMSGVLNLGGALAKTGDFQSEQTFLDGIMVEADFTKTEDRATVKELIKNRREKVQSFIETQSAGSDVEKSAQKLMRLYTALEASLKN